MKQKYKLLIWAAFMLIATGMIIYGFILEQDNAVLF
jgi:hypothetical protein